MAVCGFFRKVPAVVSWKVNLPPRGIHCFSSVSPDFTCSEIKYRLKLDCLPHSSDVHVRFYIIEVPSAASIPRLVRFQVKLKGVDALVSFIMKGEMRVEVGFREVSQEVILERANLERMMLINTSLNFIQANLGHLVRPETSPAFILEVEVDTDDQFLTMAEAQHIRKTLFYRKTQPIDKSCTATAKKGCHSNVEEKTQVFCDDKKEDVLENDSRLSHQEVTALLTLRKHFKDLLLSGDDHDVIIKIKNREFKAHRNVLRARSPVFAAMFRSEMKESTDGTITIEDCDPEAFDEFLAYVYTGKVQNLSTDKAMELYYAGDKYDFPGLKEACVEFLKTSLSTATVAGVISLALKYDEQELIESAMAFFAEHLEEVMITVEWQRFLLANPIQANEICLKSVKCRLNRN